MPALKYTSTVTPLPAGFTPGPFDVICARGKVAKNHIGNILYCQRIQTTLGTYAKADTRREKSVIVSEIVEAIRRGSPDGGFVKQINGVWCEVGDHLAREKVGQSLRDCLHELYRSGAKSKRQRRIAVGTKLVIDVGELIRSNEHISNRLGQLAADIERSGEHAPENFVADIFTQANLEILEAFKRDKTLMLRFNAVEASQAIGLLAV